MQTTVCVLQTPGKHPRQHLRPCQQLRLCRHLRQFLQQTARPQHCGLKLAARVRQMLGPLGFSSVNAICSMVEAGHHSQMRLTQHCRSARNSRSPKHCLALRMDHRRKKQGSNLSLRPCPRPCPKLTRCIELAHWHECGCGPTGGKGLL